MLSRKFSLREKILLLILAVLLVGAAYYYVIWQPSADAVTSAELRVQTAESEIMVEQVKADRMADMRAALDSLGSAADRPAAIAQYDNVENVVKALNAALAAADSYELTFRAVESGEGDRIVRRGVDMTFQCSTYAQARAVISALYDCPYRCEISGFALQSQEREAAVTAAPLTARLSITFYELKG